MLYIRPTDFVTDNDRSRRDEDYSGMPPQDEDDETDEIDCVVEIQENDNESEELETIFRTEHRSDEEIVQNPEQKQCDSNSESVNIVNK